MESRMLFEIKDGLAIPKLPSDLQGNPRVADGDKLLSIEQAAEKTGLSVAKLKRLWESTWSDLVPTEAESAVGSGQSAGNAESPNHPSAPSPQRAESGQPPTTDPQPPTDETARVSRVLQAVSAMPQDDLYHQAVRRVICGDLSNEHFLDFMAICRARNLDPLKRQIYPMTRFDEDDKRLEVIGVTSIDGFRAIAARNPKYAGQAGPQWCGPDRVWTDVWVDHAVPPVAARVGVFVGTRGEPLWSIAHWDEFAPFEIAPKGKPNAGEMIYDDFWLNKPTHMLAKVAEAISLRRALPEDLGGLYTADEIGTTNRAQPKHGSAEQQSYQQRIDQRREDAFDDSAPQTVQSLKLALINELGLNTLDAEYRIGLHRDRYQQLYNENEPAFCAAVYSSVKRTERRKGSLQRA